jgi:hypothetical protein
MLGLRNLSKRKGRELPEYLEAEIQILEEIGLAVSDARHRCMQSA